MSRRRFEIQCDKIAMVRNAIDWNQEKLADESKIGRTTLSKIESGKLRPDSNQLRSIIEALNKGVRLQNASIPGLPESAWTPEVTWPELVVSDSSNKGGAREHRTQEEELAPGISEQTINAELRESVVRNSEPTSTATWVRPQTYKEQQGSIDNDLTRPSSKDYDNGPVSPATDVRKLQVSTSAESLGDRVQIAHLVVGRLEKRRNLIAFALLTLTLCLFVGLYMWKPWKAAEPLHRLALDLELAINVINMNGIVDVMPQGADEEVEEITSLEKLPPVPFSIRRIVIRFNVKIDDAFLEKISHLTELNWLELLNDKNVTDKGVAYLERCRSLTTLDLKGTAVTDEGLVSIAKMLDLKTLKLSDTRVSDRNLSVLQRLEHLRNLYLGKTSITSEGMSAIAALKSLQKLDIHDIDIDDKGLKNLEDMKRPRNICVKETKITDEAIEKFKQRHPDCDVHRREPD